MKTNIFFLFFCVFLFGQKQKILFSVMANDKIQSEFVKANKIDSIIIFYQNEFAENESLDFDSKKLITSIKKRIPNENQKGYAVLDWEGKPVNILYTYTPVSESKYQEVQKNFLEAIKLAKALRPNIKWSYYNFPPIYYGKTSEQHILTVQQKLSPILKEIDFFAPSLYFLDNPSEEAPQFTYNYAKSNTLIALQLAQQMKKEVYPFIWHRYTDHSSESSGNLVGTVFFEKFISNILNTSFKGKFVNGVIWWECEDYIINNQNIYPKLKQQLNKNSSATLKNTFKLNVYKQYLPIIKKKLKVK